MVPHLMQIKCQRDNLATQYIARLQGLPGDAALEVKLILLALWGVLP